MIGANHPELPMWLDDMYQQATGMVMVQAGVDSEGAREHLTRYASSSAVSIEAVVDGVLGHTISFA